jgi:hypothetical protein
MRHWDTYHPRERPKELVEGSEPPKPWCYNWKEVLDGAMPVDIRPEYKKGLNVKKL